MTMFIKASLVTVLAVAVFFVGFCIGNITMPQEAYPSITVDDAMVILDRAIYSHQYYIDYPEGDIEHHKDCIKRYNQIKDLIQRLER